MIVSDEINSLNWIRIISTMNRTITYIIPYSVTMILMALHFQPRSRYRETVEHCALERACYFQSSICVNICESVGTSLNCKAHNVAKGGRDGIRGNISLTKC